VNFTKIHHSPDVDTVLEWFDLDDKGTAHRHTLESKEAPDAALPDAVACNFPEDVEQDLGVIGLSFSTENRKGKPPRRGVIVTFQYKADAFLSRMTWNTALLKEAIGDENADASAETPPGILPKSWKEPIAALEEAAVKFIQGARSQQEMPLFAGAAK
jgi:hypothetical protein